MTGNLPIFSYGRQTLNDTIVKTEDANQSNLKYLRMERIQVSIGVFRKMTILGRLVFHDNKNLEFAVGVRIRFNLAASMTTRELDIRRSSLLERCECEGKGQAP